MICARDQYADPDRIRKTILSFGLPFESLRDVLAQSRQTGIAAESNGMRDDGDTWLGAAIPHFIQHHQELFDIVGVDGNLAQTIEERIRIAKRIWQMPQDSR
jgi:hypothetical protein